MNTADAKRWRALLGVGEATRNKNGARLYINGWSFSDRPAKLHFAPTLRFACLYPAWVGGTKHRKVFEYRPEVTPVERVVEWVLKETECPPPPTP